FRSRLRELFANVRDDLGVARRLDDLRHLPRVARDEILATTRERVAACVVQRDERALRVDEVLYAREHRTRSRGHHRARRVAEREVPPLRVADVERDAADGVDTGLRLLGL